MYKGFRLKNISRKDAYIDVAEKYFQEINGEIKRNLELFLLNDNDIDGTMVQDNWFPEIKVDVFISHSHNDTQLAKGVAGWLLKDFVLKPFIDSSIWGYSNDLLKKIDKDYCWSDERRVYDYDLRNYSTAHVHMMLCTSLMKMMDSAECLFFLQTPNSTKTSTTIQNKTNSPWIYSEIAMSKYLKVTRPNRSINESRMFDESLKGVSMEYTLDWEHLKVLGDQQLNHWQNNRARANNLDHSLDILYKMTE